MPKIVLASQFERKLRLFVKRNPKRKIAVQKALRFFQENPSHPSLNSEKLAGLSIWSVRIDRGNRLFYVKDGDETIFFAVGPHDLYRSIKK